MEDIFKNYIAEINPNIIIISIIIICLVFLSIFKNRKVVTDFFNNIYNRRKKREELLKTIHENQSQIKQLMDNRLHDREQSLAIQKELTDTQKKLSESISVLSKKIDDMQQNTNIRFEESERKNNKRIRAELKDKISQSYRYYHSLGQISDMELEALEDLIEEYEEAEGSNSFVHSIVQKEMYTWEKV